MERYEFLLGFQTPVHPTIAGALGRFAAILYKLKGVIERTKPSRGRMSVEFWTPSGETNGWKQSRWMSLFRKQNQ